MKAPPCGVGSPWLACSLAVVAIVGAGSARAAIVTSFEYADTQQVAGFTTFDMFVDTGTYDWTNNRLEVNLSSGSLNHALGGPANDQPVAEAQSLGDSGVMVPSGFVGVASHVESTNTLETSWFNTTSGDTGKNQIALLTLSGDANGTISGRSISPEIVGGTTFSFTITNGWIDGVALPALTGDYDDSGLVGQGDLALVLAHWGAAVQNGQAPAGASLWTNTVDITGPIIGQDELALVLQHWGDTAAIVAELEGIAAATGLTDDEVLTLIPEPATAGVLLTLGLLIARRRG